MQIVKSALKFPILEVILGSMVLILGINTSQWLLISGVVLFGMSGFILKRLTKFDVSLLNCRIPLLFSLLGIVTSIFLRDFHEANLFLLAALAQFFAFVFVSILRQKGSFTWHSIANFLSHGTWYAVMGIFDQSKTYWMLFILYLIAIIAGRIAGVNWATFIVEKYNLKSDATRDPKLAPGKRLTYLAKEPMFWLLMLGLCGYVTYGFFSFDTSMNTYLLILIGISIAQTLLYAINARAGQRGRNWYIAITGLSAGAMFSVQTVILFSKHMPRELFIPYVLASTLGSATGAFVSMIIEYIKKIRPDEHLKSGDDPGMPKIPEWKKRLPYAIILALAAIWIFFQEPIFRFFGLQINELRFPITIVTAKIPRALILLTAATLFFLDNALHTVTSRAGNRNHTGYHISSLIPKGLIDFLRVSYLSLNTRIPDIVPISILAGCLGSLCGKDVSERIERWLQAKMDLPSEEPKPKPATA